MNNPHRPADVHRTSTGHDTDAPRTVRTQTETETERTTTPSRNDAQTRGRADETALTARLRSIDPVDALTATLLSLRPDWAPGTVRAALLRDRRPWRDITAAAIGAALDPDVRHPGAIEHRVDGRQTPTALPPSLTEQLRAPRCVHGAIVGVITGGAPSCALCRQGVPA